MSTTASLINIASAPPMAMGMTYVAAAQSVGILMQNAVMAEKCSQIISNAATEQCVVMILATGVAGAAGNDE